MTIIYILAAVLVLFLILFFGRKKQQVLSSTTTTQTTMAPPLANPMGSSGYHFLELLQKYTLADIHNLEAIALANEQKDANRKPTDPLFGTGRCATALASLCFSTIEQIGLILRKDLNSTIRTALKGDGPKNAGLFFSFSSQHNLPAVTQAEIEAVYGVFRNKITHNLFPRYSLGVSWDSNNSTGQLVIAGSGGYYLNVNFLSEYIKSAIPLLMTFLSDTTSHAPLILQVDNNAQLIDTEELRSVKARYTSDPQVRSYFTTWMPYITF